MLLKDYLIIDNVLDDPKYVVSLAKKTEFFCKTPFDDKNLKLDKSNDIPGGAWHGCRTKPLHTIYQNFFQNTFDDIFELCFPECRFKYYVLSFFHLTNDNIKKQLSVTEWWHTDDGFIFSGIIFLNENPKEQSGLILDLNGEETIIENKFNRLVLYKANLLHRPQDSFGSNLENTRLTLVFFVEKIELLSK